MRSPNAYAIPSVFVLVRDGYSVNTGADSNSCLVESRRDENGIYFHFISGHTLSNEFIFSQLATPVSAPRSIVDTYIV